MSGGIVLGRRFIPWGSLRRRKTEMDRYTAIRGGTENYFPSAL
jgi:hypothetical protein